MRGLDINRVEEGGGFAVETANVNLYNKKRYWRLVSDYLKLRTLQIIRRPCNGDAHGYVLSTCSATEHVGCLIRRGVSVARFDRKAMRRPQIVERAPVGFTLLFPIRRCSLK